MVPQEERDYIQALSRWRKKNGQAQPNHPALREVELDEKHVDIWEAFIELKASAPASMGSNVVCASDVHAWCVLNSIPEWRWATFWRVIHHLDITSRRLTTERSRKHGESASSS